MPAARWTRTLPVPLLIVAYPTIFLFSQRAPEQFVSPTGVAVVVVILVGSALAALAMSRALDLDRRAATAGDGLGALVVAPPWPVIGCLAAVFATVLAFLAADASGVAGRVVWAILLRVSFVVFLPLWLAYGATFALASLGLAWLPPAVVRPAVAAFGFGLSVPWQAVLFGLLAQVVVRARTLTERWTTP